MRSLSLVLLLASGMGCLHTAPARAERTVTVVPLTETNFRSVSPDGVFTKVTDCQVGNLNSIAWAVGEWAASPEAYYQNFTPSDGCGVCDTGFQVNAIHFFVQTAGVCAIDLSVGLYGTDFTNPDCPIPGLFDCMSNNFTVNLTGAGVWDINVPVNCPCADVTYLSAIGVEIVEYRCEVPLDPSLITDNFPVNCTSWNDYGAGMVDLVGEAGFPGNLLLFADVECCEPSIGIEDGSWGRVKGLYGND